MVELVIKISEDTYKDIVKNGFIYDEDSEVISHAIKNGKPIPKGHDRLIDANAVDKSVKDLYQNREVMYWINNAPTIIEAESENKE